MNEVKILQGSTSLVYEGITNLDELKAFAEEKASKYKNIVVTDKNVKECELQIKEITPYRTDIKKFRATVNKNLEDKKKEQLKKIDDITNIFTDVIEPVTTKIEEYKEAQRQIKISNKKALFSDKINLINADLELVNQNLFFAKIDLVEFNEEWANKKDKDIEIIIDTEVNNRNNQVKALTERLENVKTYCELLKSQYDLKTNISWEYLRERIYLDNYKELLEDMAQMQVEKEIEVIEKHEEVKELEKEIVKENVFLKDTNENLSGLFKVRIDVVLYGKTQGEIEEKILKMFNTDKIKVSFK